MNPKLMSIVLALAAVILMVSGKPLQQKNIAANATTTAMVDHLDGADLPQKNEVLSQEQQQAAALSLMKLMLEKTQINYYNEEDEESDRRVGRRQKRGEISWECTAECSAYWRCRLENFFFFGDCDEPSGCNCMEFAWQG
jgi:hypothetical protein